VAGVPARDIGANTCAEPALSMDQFFSGDEASRR